MTWLAIALKPLVWPVMAFVGLLIARWGAILVFRALPDCKLRDLLMDRSLLDRHRWVSPVVTVLGIMAIAVYAYSLT